MYPRPIITYLCYYRLQEHKQFNFICFLTNFNTIVQVRPHQNFQDQMQIVHADGVQIR